MRKRCVFWLCPQSFSFSPPSHGCLFCFPLSSYRPSLYITVHMYHPLHGDRNQVRKHRRRLKERKREEAKKHAIAHVRQAHHPKGWNRSTQAGRMIHTPFQPLGPGSDNQTPEISEEKSLWPVMPQRFGAARPKIQWKAADSAGREFGNDPKMKLIPRKLRKKIKALIRTRDLKRTEQKEKERMQKIIGKRTC